MIDLTNAEYDTEVDEFDPDYIDEPDNEADEEDEDEDYDNDNIDDELNCLIADQDVGIEILRGMYDERDDEFAVVVEPAKTVGTKRKQNKW